MRIAWSKARQIARDVANPLECGPVGLGAALGCALAAPLQSRAPQPICDIAAMDGYAVAGSGPWTVLGRVLAGDAAIAPLRSGQAAEIGTGAEVPTGTDAVIPFERSVRTGDEVSATPTGRAHIRRRGEDFGAGEILLPTGTVVTPSVVGLTAGVGNDVLDVHRRPRVGVAVTGNELLFSGPPMAGMVRDAIGPMLPGIIAEAGGATSAYQHLPDRQDAMADALATADGEVIAVCGATSAGTADHLRATLRACRADIVIDGVACRPGHPQLLAVLPDGHFVVGLPGNPYAALVAALTLLGPLLGTLAGRRPAKVITSVFGDGKPPTPHPRDTTLIAAVRDGGTIKRVGHDRPGSLWAPAAADVLAVLPPDSGSTEVEVLPLPG
ncbi:MAG: molybdopterin molybdotransferase MoeA [Sciscionella sp.]